MTTLKLKDTASGKLIIALQKHVGKTIAKFEAKDIWRGGNVQSFKVTFTDGTSLEVDADGDGGCPECDPDGCSCQWVSCS